MLSMNLNYFSNKDAGCFLAVNSIVEIPLGRLWCRYVNINGKGL